MIDPNHQTLAARPSPPRSKALPLIIVAALLLPLIAVRFHHTFGPATYDLMRDARRLVEGGGIAVLMPEEPPGYPLLLAQLFAAGVDPMLAGMLISLFAFVVSVVAAHRLLGLTLERWVLPATLVFLLQERLLSHATQAWVEGAYVASTLLALLVFGVMHRNNYRLPARLHPAVYVSVFSCVVAAPIWFRHVGLLIPVSVCTALLLGALRTKDRLAIRHCLLVAAGTACLTVAPLVHAYRLTGTLTGHPVGLAPGYTFIEALQAMVLQTGLDGFGVPFRISEQLQAAAPSLFFAITVIVLFWLLVTLDRSPLPRLIAFNIFAYLFLFAYWESSTRLDVVSMRFVYPIIPLITLLLLMKAASMTLNLRRLMMAMPAVLLLAISTTASAYKLVRGAGVTHQQREFGYAPKTTQAVLSLMRNVAPGRQLSIATNRFGEQVLAYTSKLDLKVIPYNDVFNGDFTQVYGIQTWSEAAARSYFREHQTEWIAFFYGISRVDQYMQQNAYGDFITRIHRGEVNDLELQRIELADGLLLRVKPTEW
jgi:hypothetical protein